VGTTLSPISGREVKKDDVADVLKAIQGLKEGDKVLMLVPFRQHANRNVMEELDILIQKGFSRIYFNKEILRIETLLESDEVLNKIISSFKKKSAYLLIDRLVVKQFDEEDVHRISDSAGTAFYEGEGELILEINGDKEVLFSNKFELDGITFEEPVPNLFSFNNPFGACPTCEGFSQILGVDADLVIPNKQLSLYEGAVAPWKGEKLGQWKEQFIRAAKHFNFPVHKPIIDLTDAELEILWEGNNYANGINDFFKEVEQNLYKVQYRVLLSRYRGRTLCTECKGHRLRKEALYIKIADQHIGQLCNMPVKDLKK
jgi:excinuclease ABC subunit A